jgi:hypothetical protein
VVLDQFTRRIVGFGVRAHDVDGIALCRMSNTAIATQGARHYLSSDNDPLFQYHRWQANLRILEIQEIKTVPDAALSHPFIERLIGTLRSTATHHQKPLAIPTAAVPASINSSENLIAAGYTSYP